MRICIVLFTRVPILMSRSGVIGVSSLVSESFELVTIGESKADKVCQMDPVR